MPDQFLLAPLNPIRFTPEDESDLFSINQEGRCYFQKWTRSDTTKLQILSDFPDIDFYVREYETNKIVLNITPVFIPITILGQTFSCYQVSIDFSQLQPGQYFFEMVYAGLSDPEVVLLSEPIDVQDSQPNTLLFKYKNSENNFSVIFDTGIEFNLRVEGTIKDFTPVADDVIYNDQKRNATLLNSVPYRSYKLFIGNAPGLPDWMTDKVNRIMSCDEKQIDDVYYEKIEGSKWEIVREVEYPFSGLSIEIMPVENFFLQRLKTGDEQPEGYTIVEKVKNYFANASNILVDIFVKYSLLKHISIVNYGGAITLNVGTTNGGNEIATFNVPAGSVGGVPWTGTVNYLFAGGTDVYLTGLTGSNADVMLDYLQYDETPAQPTPQPSPTLGKGAMIRYKEVVPGELLVAFDFGSGLGNVGTPWEGWAICDGRNGSDDEGGLVPVGWKDGDPDFGTLGATGGEANHLLTQDELPEVDIPFDYDSITRASGGQTTMRNFPGSNTHETINFPGGGEPHNNMQPYRVSLWVLKIAS